MTEKLFLFTLDPGAKLYFDTTWLKVCKFGIKNNTQKIEFGRFFKPKLSV